MINQAIKQADGESAEHLRLHKSVRPLCNEMAQEDTHRTLNKIKSEAKRQNLSSEHLSSGALPLSTEECREGFNS